MGLGPTMVTIAVPSESQVASRMTKFSGKCLVMILAALLGVPSAIVDSDVLHRALNGGWMAKIREHDGASFLRVHRGRSLHFYTPGKRAVRKVHFNGGSSRLRRLR